MAILIVKVKRGSVGKESTCNVWDLGSITRLGRSPREEKGYPPQLQYYVLGSSMEYIVHGVAKSQTQQSDFRFLIQFSSVAKCT